MSGSVWVASYVLLWLAVLALGVTVLALLRQIGVLHTRLRPLGGHPANEGPPVGMPAPTLAGVEYSSASTTLLAFTSPTCAICASLLPGIDALRRQYKDVAVQVISHGPGTEVTFDAFAVASTPYVVLVDDDGLVSNKGVVNSLEQVEVMMEGAPATRA